MDMVFLEEEKGFSDSASESDGEETGKKMIYIDVYVVCTRNFTKSNVTLRDSVKSASLLPAGSQHSYRSLAVGVGNRPPKVGNFHTPTGCRGLPSVILSE